MPSAVMTRSAWASAASNPARSSTHSAPRASSALAKKTRPAPRPPAAPPMGIVPRSGRPASLHSAARRASPAARMGISSGRAPFCGPNTGAAPSGPSSGGATSANATTRAASRHPDAKEASSAKNPPPSGRGFLLAFSNGQQSPGAAPVLYEAQEQGSTRQGAPDARRDRLGDLTRAERTFECGRSDEDDGRHGGGQHNRNEKPPELPQGVIACRTPCALEPDVSEANSFSQIGQGAGASGSRAISIRPRPLSFAPRRHRRFALFESAASQSSKKNAEL